MGWRLGNGLNLKGKGVLTERSTRTNQSDVYETGKDQRKSRFGCGLNSVLCMAIVNSIVLEQDKRMWPVLGKGFV